MKKRKKNNPPADLSGYRIMWLFAMFDLPVDTANARRNYTRFRNSLLKLGFTRMQFSVYARFCKDDQKANLYKKRVKECLPPEGQVRLMAVTDVQFGKMEVYDGKTRAPTEKAPEQLLLF